MEASIVFFLLFLLHLFSFHFHSHAASSQAISDTQNLRQLINDNNNSRTFHIDPSSGCSCIPVGNRDTDGLLQRQAYSYSDTDGRGSLLWWRAYSYSEDIAKYVSNQLNNLTNHNLVKMMLFVLVVPILE
ncbi:hypothetical protein SDJN03_23934, partial [Cucurbita argyrosperma subsp. sororia]